MDVPLSSWDHLSSLGIRCENDGFVLELRPATFATHDTGDDGEGQYLLDDDDISGLTALRDLQRCLDGGAPRSAPTLLTPRRLPQWVEEELPALLPERDLTAADMALLQADTPPFVASEADRIRERMEGEGFLLPEDTDTESGGFDDVLPLPEEPRELRPAVMAAALCHPVEDDVIPELQSVAVSDVASRGNSVGPTPEALVSCLSVDESSPRETKTDVPSPEPAPHTQSAPEGSSEREVAQLVPDRANTETSRVVVLGVAADVTRFLELRQVPLQHTVCSDAIDQEEIAAALELLVGPTPRLSSPVPELDHRQTDPYPAARILRRTQRRTLLTECERRERREMARIDQTQQDEIAASTARLAVVEQALRDCVSSQDTARADLHDEERRVHSALLLSHQRQRATVLHYLAHQAARVNAQQLDGIVAQEHEERCGLSGVEAEAWVELSSLSKDSACSAVDAERTRIAAALAERQRSKEDWVKQVSELWRRDEEPDFEVWTSGERNSETEHTLLSKAAQPASSVNQLTHTTSSAMVTSAPQAGPSAPSGSESRLLTPSVIEALHPHFRSAVSLVDRRAAFRIVSCVLEELTGVDEPSFDGHALGQMLHAHTQVLRLSGNALRLQGLGSVVALCPHARVIDIHDNRLAPSPNPVESESLRYLDVSSNNLETLSGVVHAPRLVVLKAHCNQLDSAAVSTLPVSLAYAELQRNRIATLSGLPALPQLLSFDVSRNGLKDLGAFWERAPHCRQLFASENDISSLPTVNEGALVRSLCLEELFMAGNPKLQIPSWQRFLMPCLSTLVLRGCGLTSLDPFSTLGALKRLDVGFNHVESLSSAARALSALHRVEDITLVENPCARDPDYAPRLTTLLPRLRLLDSNPVPRSAVQLRAPQVPSVDSDRTAALWDAVRERRCTERDGVVAFHGRLRREAVAVEAHFSEWLKEDLSRWSAVCAPTSEELFLEALGEQGRAAVLDATLLGKGGVELVHYESATYALRAESFTKQRAACRIARWARRIAFRARIMSGLRAFLKGEGAAERARLEAAVRKIQPLWRGAWTRHRLGRIEDGDDEPPLQRVDIDSELAFASDALQLDAQRAQVLQSRIAEAAPVFEAVPPPRPVSHQGAAPAAAFVATPPPRAPNSATSRPPREGVAVPRAEPDDAWGDVGDMIRHRDRTRNQRVQKERMRQRLR